jgi:hypothetical protein
MAKLMAGFKSGMDFAPSVPSLRSFSRMWLGEHVRNRLE